MFIGIATVTLGVAFDVFEFPVKRVLFAVELFSFMTPFDRGRIILAGD